VEQVKFALRLFLLVSYWKQSMQSEVVENKDCLPHGTSLGILLDGGMYHVDQPPGLSYSERKSMERREQYVGRRTGLRVAKAAQECKRPQRLSLIVLGELLYALRPLYWASAEAKHFQARVGDSQASSSQSLLKAWLTTLAMDSASLGLFSTQHIERNRWSREEWNRRRMKLFLYLLRSPVWSRLTSPVLERSSSIVQRIPLLGRLVDACLWDWILYWKQPYISEEG
jgi:hypothetical protein